NPSTRIRFDIAKSSNVTLKIYDASGKEVLKVTDAFMNAGSYSFEWNASRFASGIYFYKLTAGGFTDVKKMILIK
ncbi:MAG TPA: T9SS type A sorting domain-containing protein, partial [Ignavibacteria bacterium]|nr:T9SS type A sorting domain-containing protein [Ignavibacteria bacterium]